MKFEDSRLAILSELTTKFQEYPVGTPDYQYIADRFFEVSGAMAVLVQSYQESSITTKTEAIAGASSVLSKIQAVNGIMGFDIFGSKWPLTDLERNEHKSKKFIKCDLYKLTIKTIPEEACKKIEDLLELGDIYITGLAHGDYIFGDIVLSMPRGRKLENIDFLAIMVKQITAVFWRNRIEEELIKSEERYHSLIEYSRDAIFVANPDGRFIEVNLAACKLIGRYRSELLEMEIPDLLATNDNNGAFNQLKREGTFLGEIILRGKDGRHIMVEVSANTLPDGNFLGMARDITYRKRVEAEAIKAQKLESIGVLAGGIAHDFNNFLALMMGNIQLIEKAGIDGRNSARLTKYLNSVKESIKRATSLTNQLLTFSKGGQPVREIVYIKELIKETVDFATVGSTLTYNLKTEEDIWPVRVDKGQISQVISNIIINADQATPEGARRHIDITLMNTVVESERFLPLAKGKYVMISIKDYGVGIPPEDLERIFDPFFTTKFKGNGLGLTTSYSIIKNHKGHITVDSKMGKGTTVNVLLPVLDINQGFSDPKTRIAHRHKKRKILLMEDENELRAIIHSLLVDKGYHVEVAVNGEEALEHFRAAKKRNEPFDVLVMDLVISGGMSGVETIKKVRETDRQVPVIASSGYSNHPVMADYKKYGFTGVLVKPYQIEELCEIIDR